MIHQARFSNGGPYPIHFGTCSECPSFGRQRKTASGALLKSFVGVRGIWLLRGRWMGGLAPCRFCVLVGSDFELRHCLVLPRSVGAVLLHPHTCRCGRKGMSDSLECAAKGLAYRLDPPRPRIGRWI